MWSQSTGFPSTGNIHDELRYACLHNDIMTLRRLCKLNANVEIEDSHCTTPLMLACYYGNYDIVHELISNQNVLIDHGDINDVKPLHYACEQQHLSIVTLLLENNADIHSQTKKGWTALHYAADASNFDLIKLLLINGADKTIKDNYNRTPYDIVSKRNIADLICLFQLESLEDIRNLISPNSTSHHRHNSTANKKHSEQRSNYSLELEKERIMRGEISLLKDKINDLQFENDKLINRVSSVEGGLEELTISIQGFAGSIQSILSFSPISIPYT